jgi:dienelactone hydrolase
MKMLALSCVVALQWVGEVAAQVALSRDAQPVQLREGLVVEAKGSWSRRLINTDPVVQRVVRGELGHVGAVVPKEGERLIAGDEASGVWEKVAAGEDGAFEIAAGRYLLVTVTSELERVMVLEARGHGMVYVNGEPRVGDPYGHGYVRVPVLMRKGVNTLLFAAAGRGGMKAELRQPKGAVELTEGDIPAPDVLDAGVSVYWMGVPVMNNTRVVQRVKVSVDAKNRSLEELTRYWGHFPKMVSEIVIPPMSVAKVPVRFDATYEADGSVDAMVFANADSESARVTVALAGKAATATHKRTFVSGIDGSVQYYSVVPAAKDPWAEVPPEAPGLVLSLHGASVEATNQAASYSAKTDFVIVCPTNRRPFGFDWEDWGRVDALEVLNVSRRILGTHPRRQYVTGHSMGGHGTWQMATLYPDQFAAAAPSAGWLSFDTYAEAGGAPREQAARMRAGMHASSWTMDRLGNMRRMGVYLVHGTADDNVPASEAYRGAARLSLLSMDVGMHMEAGAGHWWDDGENGLPGAACVDWPAVFEMFREHELPARGSGEAFVLRAKRLAAPIDARGMAVGSFKRAFDRDFVMVYGTAGSDEVDAWALAKARFDAETWWYRGNGYAKVLRDVDVTGADVAGRNVIVYGPAEHQVWAAFAGANPRVPADVTFAAREASVREGAEGLGGWMMLFGASDRLGDARGADLPTIAVISGESVAAMRALDRLPIFSSGVMIPTRLRVREDVWTVGASAVLER